jgi:ABC-type phosphate transport system substrate-binding protein
MPPHPKKNFSRAEVEGIIEGTISDWSQLFDDNGAQMAAGGIVFLDRGEGSGSKASGNQYFLCYPGCGASARPPFSSLNNYTGTTATIAETSQDVAEASSSTLIADLKALQAARQTRHRRPRSRVPAAWPTGVGHEHL